MALSLDTFAVSLTLGMAGAKVPRAKLERFIIVIGIFHFMMILLGWLMGEKLSDFVSGYDHWIAFALLALIGAKMIWESVSSQEKNELNPDTLSFSRTIILGLALSIDALITGFSMGIVEVEIIKGSPLANILISGAIIGLCASLLSQAGLTVGRRASVKLSSKAELLGGIILILIGVKILLEHILL